jgi:hypothetical protein
MPEPPIPAEAFAAAQKVPEADYELVVRAAAPHIARAAVAAELRAMTFRLDAYAEELREPLPQGDRDIEAREAVDYQAIGVEKAADELRGRVTELEANDA